MRGFWALLLCHQLLLAAARASALRAQTLASATLQQRIDAKLQQLHDATLRGGEDALRRLEDVLPAILVQVESGSSAPVKPISKLQVERKDKSTGDDAASGSTGDDAASGSPEYTAAITAHVAASKCIFDDAIFSLTPATKAELRAELMQPAAASSLQFVRRGGWWSCATADWSVPISCHCNGNVRLVDLDRNEVAPAAVDASLLGGAVACTSASFGVAPIVGSDARFPWRGCECAEHPMADASSPDGYHLSKKLTSKSVLQEGWLVLTRLLGRSSLLPLGTGDRTYKGIENWSARMPPWAQSNFPNYIFERHWVDKFIRSMIPHLPGPKCLEWGHPDKPGQMMHYVHRVPQCTEPYDMQFDYIHYQNAPMHISGNIVHSDILSLPTVLGPNLKMNVIFATQVFEHVADPMKAASALFEALAPGGALIFTAPQSAPFHKVPHDYYRYTAEGAKYVLVQAGFCAPNHLFSGGGDFVFSVAADAGLQIQDFPMEEVDGAYQSGFDSISHDAIGIHVLAFKAPHPACDDPTAGWAYMTQQGMKP